MPTDPAAGELRRRAAALRRLAAGLDATPMLTLRRWAGSDTWTSPRAEELRGQLDGHRARVLDAADDLRRQADRLDDRADELDAAAAIAAATAPAR